MTRIVFFVLGFGLALSFILKPAMSQNTNVIGSDNSSCRCQPDKACWPDKKAWKSLSEKVSGNLVQPKSSITACEKDVASDACKVALKNLHNPFTIENNPGDTQSQGWMGAWMAQPSTYAVEATGSSDVVAAVNFAREHNLRVVIKGTGHDYLGRSSAPNSLLIWTHKMRDIEYIPSFSPAGCDAKFAAVSALTVGAGTRWLEAYDVATNKNNRYVQGGGCTTVGVAGGFTQGGGFGSYSKRYGTGASSILQVEIVTADGKTLVANQCQNTDLFWAIRGGGAGTYGVVTQMTIKTHALPSNFGVLEASFKAATDDDYKKLILKFISFYRENLNNEKWGEQIHFNTDNSITTQLLFSGISKDDAVKTFDPLMQWMSKHEGKYVTKIDAFSIPANKMWNYDFWKTNHPRLVVKNDAKDAKKDEYWWQPNVGEVSKYWFTYQSWWVPAKLFEEKNKKKLANTIFKASRLTAVRLQINKGLSGAPKDVIEEARLTATNPSMLDAAGIVIMGAGTNKAFVGVKGKEPDQVAGQDQVDKISQAIKMFRDLAPNAGSYINETDYFLQGWQKAFWGKNYSKLLKVKKKYDPKGMFYCHHCVGSEAWTDDGMCRV